MKHTPARYTCHPIAQSQPGEVSAGALHISFKSALTDDVAELFLNTRRREFRHPAGSQLCQVGGRSPRSTSGIALRSSASVRRWLSRRPGAAATICHLPPAVGLIEAISASEAYTKHMPNATTRKPQNKSAVPPSVRTKMNSGRSNSQPEEGAPLDQHTSRHQSFI